MRYLNATVIGR